MPISLKVIVLDHFNCDSIFLCRDVFTFFDELVEFKEGSTIFLVILNFFTRIRE